MSDLVLVVDDDADLRDLVGTTLELAGFDVATADEGAAGFDAALTLRPDLVVLDLMMPVADGHELCRRLRADARVSHIPIIMLTAKAQLADKIAGLAQGADDYITKPFDTDELVARVAATLRRVRDTRSVSPLTGLPGNVRIEQELAQRVASGEPFALLYADLNRFKAYNDRYGFLRGDAAIRALADAIRAVVAELGDARTFVGHIGGDDLVVVTASGAGEAIAGAVAERFDAVVPGLYDPDDWEAGYIEVEDRQGNPHRYAPLTVSIGIVDTALRRFGDHRELVEVATEMKNFVKRRSGDRSDYAVDRRSGR